MSNFAVQSFLIHRHGERYSIKRPEHNGVWPSENKFWKSHAGTLSPVGVINMYQLGQIFRDRYPWVDVKNTEIFSTHRSRALESAWSFVLGLLPDTPLKFETMKSYRMCNDKMCCKQDICCIFYYHKGDDLIFGEGDPSMAYKININSSSLLQELSNSECVNNLIHRLNQQGYFRLRRDTVTTISKLKDIYAQLMVDSQLRIPDSGSLIGKYQLTPEEIDIITQIGSEVICRRLVPATDLIQDQAFNEDQGRGIITTIQNQMEEWDGSENSLTTFSCHDTNIIAVMALLGIKIIPPDFSGYLLIERIKTPKEDHVYFYYCPYPFDEMPDPKVWSDCKNREHYIDWDELSPGNFTYEKFRNCFQSK